METVRSRVKDAPSEPLQPPLTSAPKAGPEDAASALSEQTALVLALIDGFPYLPIDVLEEWLPLVAESLADVRDDAGLQICRQRFWEILTSGELDVNRAAVSMAWWTTGGGCEKAIQGRYPTFESSAALMSGAVGDSGRL